MIDISPVIILGNNRSGTTFLGNFIADNFDVATLSHPLHFGILESNIYSYKHYFGDFSDTDTYIRSVSMLSESDLYVTSGLPKTYFLENRAQSFYHLFLQLMDEYTLHDKKNRWVTKLDPLMYAHTDELNLFMELLNSRYKRVDFISITRDYSSYIRSVAQLGGKKAKTIRGSAIRRNIFIGHRAALYFHNNRIIDNIAQTSDGLKMSFKNAVSNPELAKTEIARKLDVEPVQIAPKIIRHLNASEKSPNFPGAFASRIWLFIFRSVPMLSTIFALVANRFYRSKLKNSPLWWRLAKQEYFEDELVEELKVLNQSVLVEELRSK